MNSFSSEQGVSEQGVQLDIVDDMKAELHQAAAGTVNAPLSFIKIKSVFGDLARDKTFAKTYTAMVTALYSNPKIAQHMQAVLFGRE